MRDGQGISPQLEKSHRLSRRRFLAALAASAGAVALAACGGSTTATDTPKPAVPATAAAANVTAPASAAANPTSAAASAPATTGGATAPASSSAVAVAPPGKGKVLRLSRNAEPGFPFIGWSSEDNASEFTMINIYDGLVRPTKDGQGVEPALATKWETSADGKTWTFTLRDAKFSDGKALVAADVKASLDMCRMGPKSQWKDTYKAITDVQAMDDKTVKIVLSQPHPPLLAELAMWTAQIMPADMALAIDQPGYDTYKTRGTGAYFCEGWKKGDVMVLKKNPFYWKTSNGPDEVRIEYIPDDNTRILKLQGGETDVIDFVPLSQIQSLNQGNTKAQAFTIQTYFTLPMNLTIKPLDDKNVRQALNYALDKEAILKAVFFGQAKFQNSPIPPGTYWDKNLKGYPFDLDKAKQLMAASSVPKGFTFEQTIAAGNNVAQAVATIAKDQWAKIGVTVNISQIEASSLSAKRKEGSLMAWTGGWTNDMSDPTEIANRILRGGTSTLGAYTRYNNPALNTLIDSADLEQDPKKREMLYSQVQQTYLDDAPQVFIAYPPATAAWQTYVSGFNLDTLSFYRFEDVRVNK
ncbi:MAG: ABC transporter substrate-binding protein [Chloroflexota bacterium]|nr:ABC transporter substrate-binding protein [Chloroflexota bacterium]